MGALMCKLYRYNSRCLSAQAGVLSAQVGCLSEQAGLLSAQVAPPIAQAPKANPPVQKEKPKPEAAH